MTTHNPFLVIFDLDYDTDTPEEKLKNALSWNSWRYARYKNIKSVKRSKLITCAYCGTTHTLDYYRDHVLMKKHIKAENEFIKKSQLK
jgi:hypothetical protein